MFWPFKKKSDPQSDQLALSSELFRAALKQSDLKQATPPPKFKRGDKVRDIYDGPVMVVDNPKDPWIISVFLPISKFKVKCVRWHNEKFSTMFYDEDELISAEEQ